MHDEYKRAATFYDPLLSRPLRFIRTNICTYIRHCRTRRVIDICCGTGEQLQMLSKEDLSLTGVDSSPAMLEIARKKSHNSIRYLESDAACIPLPDSSFSTAILSFALHEKTVDQQIAIFREACRLIDTEGAIIIADYCTPPDSMRSILMGMLAIPFIERLAGLNHYHNYRDWMQRDALSGFLNKENPGKTLLIAPHLQGCVQICAVTDMKVTPLQVIGNEIS